MQDTIKQQGRVEIETTFFAFGQEWEIKISDRDLRYGQRRWNSKKGGYVEPLTRIFVSTPDEFDGLATAAHPHPTVEMFPALALGSVYTSRGEHPEVDKAWDQFNRAFVKGQSEVLSALALFTGVDEFHFDKHAGCTCPCSPGFVAKTGRRSRGTTIFVDIKSKTA